MKEVKLFEEFISEGRGKYDSIAGGLVRKIFPQWVKDWKSGKASSSFMAYIDEPRIQFDLEVTIYFGKVQGFEVLDTTGADGRAYDDDGDEQDPYIIIDFAVNKDWLPGYWQEIYMHLSDVMRHEIEHITQDGKEVGNYKAGKPDEDDSMLRMLIQSGILPKSTYLTLPKEIDANLQGLRYEAKKRKISMVDAVNNYLDTQTYLEEDPSQRQMVLDTWRRRALKIGGIPKF